MVFLISNQEWTWNVMISTLRMSQCLIPHQAERMTTSCIYRSVDGLTARLSSTTTRTISWLARWHRFRMRPRFRTRAVYCYLEGFYNRRRVYSALDYQSPVTYEKRFAVEHGSAKNPKINCLRNWGNFNPWYHRDTLVLTTLEISLVVYAVYRSNCLDLWTAKD